ncbi:MAG: DUF2723 domain-containing protein [Caldilineaceae bacterium]|nr:DUF2723 domain-containing protein [Caldilineaceae bacterium]
MKVVSSADDRRGERWGRLVQWIGIGLLGGALVLYGLTLDNGLQPSELIGGDLITHQYAQVQARPSNAPGYPLYTMGGWLWFHTIRWGLHTLGYALPNPMPILSSYSTLWALLALWLFYRILCRLTRTPSQPWGAGWLAGLLCAFYAVTYFFWYYATTTEQYSSAIAHTLAIVYLYLIWQRQQSQATATGQASSPAARASLLWLAFLCGLALAHMLTVAFIVPPLVLVILWQAPQLLRMGRLVAGTVIAAFIPLVSYLYVYWRGMLHPEWWGSERWATPQAWFWAFVSTAQGREELRWGLQATCAFFANDFPKLMGQELTWPLLIVGLIGLAWLEKRQAVLLYGTTVIYLIFCWLYRCGNWYQVILPLYPLILLGVAALLMAVRQSLPGGRWVYRVALFLLVLAIGWRFVASLPAANSRNRAVDRAFDQAAVRLAQPLPWQAPLFAAVEDALAFQYLSAIWQIRPDLQIIDSRQAGALLAAGQPVFSTWEAAPTLRAELPTAMMTTTVTTQQAITADWVAFLPATAPAMAVPTALTITDQALLTDTLILQGYTVAPLAASPLARYRQPIADQSQGLAVTLFWQVPPGAWPAGVSISLRLLQGTQPLFTALGTPLQQDRQQPAMGHYQLKPSDVIVDPYAFALPVANQAAVTQLQILLYQTTAAGFENLAELYLPVFP